MEKFNVMFVIGFDHSDYFVCPSGIQGLGMTRIIADAYAFESFADADTFIRHHRPYTKMLKHSEIKRIFELTT